MVFFEKPVGVWQHIAGMQSAMDELLAENNKLREELDAAPLYQDRIEALKTELASCQRRLGDDIRWRSKYERLGDAVNAHRRAREPTDKTATIPVDRILYAALDTIVSEGV